MGQVLLLTTALFVALVLQDGGLAGFALTSAVDVISVVTWFTRQRSELELSMNSVERLLEYQTLDSERAAIIPDSRCDTA